MKKMCENLGITNLRPVRKGTDGISKFGSGTFCGQLGSEKVKVTAYKTREQIDLLEYIRGNNLHTECVFPKIIANEGNILVEEWINGKLIIDLDKRKQIQYGNIVFKFMQQCKRMNIAGFPASFDYLSYLESRLDTYDDKNVQQFLNEWKSQRDSLNIKPLLGHNDLSRFNIIVDKTGRLYIIDHEMFGVSSGWFLAWRNSFVWRLHKDNQLFNNFYDSIPQDNFYDSIPQDFVDMTWRLRKIGSNLEIGRYERAMKYAKTS